MYFLLKIFQHYILNVELIEFNSNEVLKRFAEYQLNKLYNKRLIVKKMDIYGYTPCLNAIDKKGDNFGDFLIADLSNNGSTLE